MDTKKVLEADEGRRVGGVSKEGQGLEAEDNKGNKRQREGRRTGPEVTVRETEANKIGRQLLVETQSAFKSYLKIAYVILVHLTLNSSSFH